MREEGQRPEVDPELAAQVNRIFDESEAAADAVEVMESKPKFSSSTGSKRRHVPDVQHQIKALGGRERETTLPRRRKTFPERVEESDSIDELIVQLATGPKIGKLKNLRQSAERDVEMYPQAPNAEKIEIFAALEAAGCETVRDVLEAIRDGELDATLLERMAVVDRSKKMGLPPIIYRAIELRT